ncbi:hypothetical protein D1820_07850 [Phaeobacter sp. LSS9]|uniref:hypothetical protein n=1 Tax=unclassified Phaeobacter TaxID=2621772 RepID=UPI000E50DCB3|nr:hypothetical protein [Phaeobacter sp. LSS9]AXT34885.1 hypothetical protein D1820_07850 [Phaeobacter sp. LSS9]
MIDDEYSHLARVVQIVDDYEVVVNRGTTHGLKNGDHFMVFAVGDEIFDPETNESLGRLETVRGRTVVTHAQANMSTLRSITKLEVSSGRRIYRKPSGALGTLNALAGITYGMREEEIVEEPNKKLAELNATIGDYVKPI